MKYLLTITYLLFSFYCRSQVLTCEDFKTGVFYIKVEVQPPILVKVIREKDKQIEIVMNPKDNPVPNTREKTFETIGWIDECSFRLRYDSSKMELNDLEKFYNANGGILVKLNQPIDKCSDYDSTFVYKEKETTFSLRMCKE